MTLSTRFHQLGQILDRRYWPLAWLVSLAMHLAALILLAMVVHVHLPRGTGIELQSRFETEGKESRFADEQAGGSSVPVTVTAATPSAPANASPQPTLAELLQDAPSVDPTQALPNQQMPIGPTALETGGVGQAMGATRGTGAGGGQGLQGLGSGKATTAIFGVRGEGFRFVYVFDRSASTGEILPAAQAQLIASIESLDKIHQFGIIFYNETPTMFNPTGQSRLVFATEQNKELARRFIRSITSDGGTRHEEALTLALKFSPDVVFFLTDGDEPRLYPHQLQRIQKVAGGTKINTIEFGAHTQPDPNGFLVRLARLTDGQYAYVDVTTLRPNRP